MAESDITEEDIAKKVEETLSNAKFLNREQRMPVDIIELVRSYDFSVYQVPMEDNVSGLIMASDKKIDGFNTEKLILINSLHSTARKRFTIAHELGHYIMENQSGKCYSHRNNAQERTPAEKNADIFASRLLMPNHELNAFLDCINRERDESDLIQMVADIFKVSKDAAKVRLEKAGIM